MKTIIVKSQSELDALPSSFKEFTQVQIVPPKDTTIRVSVEYNNGYVVARESAHVEAWGSAHVVAWESAHVVAWGSAHVEAWGSAHVEAWGSAHVEAWGSAHVVAWESAHVVARGSAHVVARGSAHVVARGSVSISCQSDDSSLVLFGFAVATMVSKAKSCLKKSKTCTVVNPKSPEGNNGWLESQGIEPVKGLATLFKRVSKDFKTQEGNKNETLWKIGTDVEILNWNPNRDECGEGKLHACSHPYFCDEFRSNIGDVYIAIEISVKDLHAWPNANYPHKIAFKKGKVLFQCDRFGNKVKA